MKHSQKMTMRVVDCGYLPHPNPLPQGARELHVPHSALRIPNSKGFTLIEIVLTIVLVGILAGVAAVIIMQGARSYSTEQSRGEAHEQARFALDRMAREVRLIRSCAAIIGPANPSNTLSFTDINGNAVVFSVAGVNLMRGPDLLASGVTSAQPFRFLDSAGNETTACPGIWFIEINLTDTQRAESLTLRTRVHPRNF